MTYPVMNEYQRRALKKRRARILNMLRIMRRPLRLDDFATLSGRSAPPIESAVLATLADLEREGFIARDGDAWRFLPPHKRHNYETMKAARRRDRERRAVAEAMQVAA